MTWTIPAPQVQDGDPVNAQSVNKSTNVLSERTAILKTMIDNLQAGQNLVIRNIPVDDEVLEGHVVYFDDTEKFHKKALAQWDDLNSPGFTAEPADSSVYSGIVVAKPTTQLADILLSGMASLDPAAEARLFDGATPESGLYYLSNSVEGTVVAPRPAMSVRVLEYMTGGVVRVFSPAHEPITHTHLAYDLLQGDWLPVGSFVDPPAGVSHGYDMTSAHAVQVNLPEALLAAVGDETFVGKTSGLHLFDDQIFLDEFGIWWIDGTAPTEDIDLKVLSADVKDMSLIHTIMTQTPQAIELVNSNGRVVLNLTEYGTEDVAVTGKAVVSVDFANHKLNLAAVVTSIAEGAGVKVTSNAAGQYTVASALFNNLPILANLLNLNNAVTSVEGPHAIVEFPSDRDSVVACACAIPELSDGTYVAKIWVQAISPANGQAAPDVEFSLIPTPDAAGVTPSANTAIALPAFPGSTNAGDVYYTETADIALTGASRGQLNYTLTLNSPANSLKVIATGIKLIQQ